MANRTTGTIVDATVFAGSDSADDFPVSLNNEVRGAVQFFSSIADRDNWSTSYPSRRYATTAIVFDKTVQPPQTAANFYRWSGLLEDGSDGKWELLPIAHSADTVFIKWNDTSTGDSGKIAELSYGTGIRAKQDAGSETLNIGIDEGIFADSFPSDFISYAQNRPTASAKPTDVEKRSTMWFGDPVFPTGPYVVNEKVTKTITIIPRPNVPVEQYIVCFDVHFSGFVPSAGNIIVAIRNVITGGGSTDYLYDINGVPLVGQRTYKEKENIGQIIIAGVFEVSKITELTFNIVTTFEESIRLDEYVNNPSAIMLQSLDGVPRALWDYEKVTDTDIKYYVHKFPSILNDMTGLLNTDMPERTYDKYPLGSYSQPFKFFSEDGYWFVPLRTTMNLDITDKVMNISNTPGVQEIPYGYVVYYLTESETNLLRGKKVGGDVIIGKGEWAGQVLVAAWSGTSRTEDAPNVIIGYDNTIQYGADWAVLGTDFIIADVVNDNRKGSILSTIPDNTRLIAVVFAADEAQSPLKYAIKEFNIRVDPPFTGAGLKYVTPADEKFFNLTKKHERFEQDHLGYANLRYTINDTYSPCPIGVLQDKLKQLPVVLDETINTVPGSVAHGGEGVLKFVNAIEEVTIKTTVRVYPGEGLAGGTVPVYFQWYSIDESGVFRELSDAQLLVSVSKGNPAVVATLSITKTFYINERIGLKMRSTGKDYAYLESKGTMDPLIVNLVSIEDEVG